MWEKENMMVASIFSFLYARRVVLCYTPGRPSVCPSVSNFLCAQLLLQFPSELFETCHNESPWCLVVHLGLRIWIAVCVLKLSAPDFWNNTLFTLNFCPGHNFHTIKGLNFKQPILHFNSFHWQAPSGVYAPLCEALVPQCFLPFQRQISVFE